MRSSDEFWLSIRRGKQNRHLPSIRNGAQGAAIVYRSRPFRL